MLVAGYATRLYPLTENKAKGLLPLNGRPIIDYTFDKQYFEDCFFDVGKIIGEDIN